MIWSLAKGRGTVNRCHHAQKDISGQCGVTLRVLKSQAQSLRSMIMLSPIAITTSRFVEWSFICKIWDPPWLFIFFDILKGEFPTKVFLAIHIHFSPFFNSSSEFDAFPRGRDSEPCRLLSQFFVDFEVEELKIVFYLSQNMYAYAGGIDDWEKNSPPVRYISRSGDHQRRNNFYPV